MPKQTNILIILGVISTTFLVGWGVTYFSKEVEQLGVAPSLINWEKPNTDAEWAEDVKKESLDIRSTGVLHTMVERHTEKLAREEKAFVKYRDCLECIRFEMRETLSGYTVTSEELEAEVEKQTQEAINGRAWSIEKLKQSIERMGKEIELREKGFVVVEGESELLGGVDPKYIRYIHD